MNKLKQIELIEGFMENIKQKIYYNKDEVDTCLDKLVLELQIFAYEAEKARHIEVSNEKQKGHYYRARAYLDAVGEINKTFGTNYAQSIEKVIKHFETKAPAKD